MGNLGAYQAMTQIAKKVGGPKVLAAITLIGGYVVIRPAEAGARWAVETFRTGSRRCPTSGQQFRVASDGNDGGLEVRVGDEYRVLECDGDAILIEVLGNPNNPYFVASEFLRSVSDFPPVQPKPGPPQD